MRRGIVSGIAALGLLYLYLVALVCAVGVAAAWPTPRGWLGTFSAHRGAILSWLFIAHISAVLIVSVPFAWVIARFYRRFDIALSIAFGLVIWGIFEAPLAVDAFRSYGTISKGFWLADSVQFVGTLPALVLLLRRLPSNKRLERSRP